MAKILLIDDEEGVLKILKIRLEEYSHEVLTANGGTTAMSVLMKDFISSREIEIVASDYMMPDMDGLQLIQELYATFGDQYPFMFVSNIGTSDIIKTSMELGSAAFFQKPVLRHHYDALNSSIKDVIERHRLRKISCEIKAKNSLVRNVIPLIDSLEKKVAGNLELLNIVKEIKAKLMLD
ncbi:MAG: response regulator [Desulfobacterales bacterium]|nr:response regulator [Desulfobacterales bacterium]